MNSSPRKMLKKFKEFSRRHLLLEKGEHLLVAVSGGPDSVALLKLLLAVSGEMDLKISVIHLDHCLRGASSKADARWVSSLSSRLELPVFTGRRRVAEWARRKKVSPEEAARLVRYRFFQAVSRKTGIRKIALGHQADDQAETVLMRLLRGTSPAGLAAMRPLTEMGDLLLIRPLLPFWRKEIIGYLDEIGQEYRQDRSNRDRRFFRNRVRLDLISLLEDFYSPRIKEILVNLARAEGERESYIADRVNEIRRRLVEIGPDGLRISIKKLLDQPAALRKEVLKKALFEAGCSELDRRHGEKLDKLLRAETGKKINLPGGVTAKREYDRLLLLKRGYAAGKKKYSYQLKLPGETIVPQANLKVIARRKRWSARSKLPPAHDLREYWSTYPCLGESRAYFSADRLSSPLVIRSRHPGDRYRPMGLRGSKKIKDIFIDEKIPPSLRDRICLVADREKILWIIGGRPAESARLGKGVQEVVEVRAVPLRF